MLPEKLPDYGRDRRVSDLFGSDEADFEAGSHSNDERWLISYSDMMTLLFGFFVLMYSIAIQNQGNLHSRLKAIASQMMGKPVETAEAVPKESTMESELQQSRSDLLAARTDLNASHSELEKTKQALDEEKSKAARALNQLVALEREKKELKATTPEAVNHFMMVVTQWKTEKHDVDLVITDPQKHVFTYRNTTFGKVPGAFVLDSRYGPGVEMWQANSFLPGKYKVAVNLYNKHGNEIPAAVETSILTNAGTFKLPSVSLDGKIRKTAEFSFVVSDRGGVEFEAKPQTHVAKTKRNASK